MGRFSQCCLAAAIALISFGGIGIGIGMAGGSALDAIARQPMAAELITEVLFNYVLIPQFILVSILTGISLLMLCKMKKHTHCD